MKKIVFLFTFFSLLLTSCGLMQMISYPQEIRKDGGKVTASIIALDYEVKKGDKIVQKQRSTQSYIYFFEKDGKSFVNFRRSINETRNTPFLPQDFTIEIDEIREKEFLRKPIYFYYCHDVDTGKEYTLTTMYWTTGYGKFYIIGDKYNQVVYSASL